MAFIFSDEAFNAFNQDTVDQVMGEFRRYVQPSLRKYGQTIRMTIEDYWGLQNIPMHVAKHIRRKVSIPFNTWVAIGGDQRGYKKYTHLQLGINAEYVFLVLALIDHPTYEKDVMNSWKKHPQLLNELPEDMVFIYNHTQLPYDLLSGINKSDIFQRPNMKAKADIMIGRILLRNDPVLLNEEKFQAWIDDTLIALLPLYREAYETEQRLIAKEK